MAALGNMYNELYKAEQTPSIYTISAKVAEAIMGAEYNTLTQNGKSGKVPAKLVTANVLLELNKKVMMLQSTNVLGYLEGTDKKDEWLIITAHYDHLGKRGDVIYYGADDDGSGTVSVLEIAEAFAKAKAAGNGPRRNVLIMTVSGEEKGLWGSEYFSDNPAVPLDKVTAGLNIDMVGRVDTERKTADTLNYIYVVGDDKLSTELKPLSEAVNKKYPKLTLDYKFNDPNDQEQIYFRSDHYNFARKGVPVIFYYDGMLKADYHKPTDTPDKINYELMSKRARLVFLTAWEMANRNEMMKRDLALPTMRR
jgi:Zn-dependent M28 family amino/carboxypeptidase